MTRATEMGNVKAVVASSTMEMAAATVEMAAASVAMTAAAAMTAATAPAERGA